MRNSRTNYRPRRIIVSETRLDSTVVRRQFAPFAAVAGLIADAIASEKARASALASYPSGASVAAPTPSASRNGTSPSKPNGHAKPTIATLRVEALLPEPPTTRHQNPNRRFDNDNSGQDDYYPHIPKRSWKRYRAKQWRDDGNRWRCRREALAFAVAAW